MNKTLAISAIALIAVIMVVDAVSPTVFADKPEKEKSNNGGNGCENANPNAKACENNPNSDPVICQDCNDAYWEAIEACGDDSVCEGAAYAAVLECHAEATESTGELCSFDDRGR